MKEYIKLLKAQEVFRRLSVIQLIAYFGAWFSNVAIYTLLLELEVSADVVAFVAMLHFLSGVFQAPISGSIIDSMKPKKLLLILISLEIVATISLVFIDSVDDLNFLYVLIFIKMAAASFYFSTEMSLLPKILSGIDLQRANELHSIIWSFSYTLGMALSGFVVYMFGVDAAFILDAMMFVMGFFLLYTLSLHVEIDKQSENIFKMIVGTFSYIKQNKIALHLMILHAFVGFSAFDALVALMVDKFYASIIATSLGLGLLHASRALGLVIGPVLLRNFTKNRYIGYIFFAQAIAVMIWAVVMEDFYLSLFASVIVGLFTTTLWSYTYTLLQKNIDAKYYGRIVAYNDMLFLSIAAFTSYMIGFLATEGFTLQVIAACMGLCFMFGGLYFKWIVKYKKIEEVS
jgi:MFS family permease